MVRIDHPPCVAREVIRADAQDCVGGDVGAWPCSRWYFGNAMVTCLFGPSFCV